MKNRKLLLVASLVLAVSMSLGGTLAYLTDTDETVNVMTLGNVDIEQIETDAAGNPFKNNQPLYPAYYTMEGDKITSDITGEIEKVVSVKNEGTAEAYVRTLLAFEAGELSYADFKANIHTQFNDGAYTLTWLETPIKAKGVKYYVACADYGKLAGKATSDATLQSVYMDKTATNEIVKQFGDTYEIVALSQAVQTTNMPDADTAWKESFGDFTAANAEGWFNGVSTLPVTVVATVDELQAAITKGGTVMLGADITLDEPMTVANGVQMTLDLNGKTLSSPEGYVFENMGNLTITGEGNLGKGGLGGIRSKGGSVTIEGGTFTGSSDWSQGTYQHILKAENTNVVINGGTFDANLGKMTNAMINVSNGSTVTINGGTFKNVEGAIPQFAPYMFTYEKNGKLIINDGEFYGGWRFNGETATTDIYGGTFEVSFDGQSFHANSTHVLTVYGGTFSDKNGGKLAGRISDPQNKHVADGYVTEKIGDWYVVGEGEVTVVEVNDQATLDAAVTAGKNVELGAGTYTFPGSKLKKDQTITCEEGTVFEGNSKLNINGATVIGGTFSNPGGTAVDQTINGTFKDCTFTGQSGLRWCYAGETVVFENCEFAGDLYGVHFDGGANEVIFKNCTISGFNAMGGAITKLTMEGCTFKPGKSGYNGINLWGSTDMKDCTFIFDETKIEWVDARGDNTTLTFTGCVISDGTTERALTAADVGDYGTGNTITVQ